MKQMQSRPAWRCLAAKLGVLALLWTLFAAMFATQFYWLGKNTPVQLSWTQAFRHSFLEWCPWLVLSPIVIWLAERFQFDRERTLWGILPHLLASVFIVLSYQGISQFLAQPRSGIFFQSSVRDLHVINGGVGLVGGFVSESAPPPTFPPPVVVAKTNVSSGVVASGEGPPAAGRRAVAVHVFNRVPPPWSEGSFSNEFEMPAPAGRGAAFPRPFLHALPGPWTRFLQSAATRAQMTIPIYWAIVCVTWVIGYYQQLRERERRTLELEARLTHATLQTLKSQLQPHFLFNTLNAIASLVRRNPEAAEDMIGSLSDFLRMNLDAAQQHEVLLRRELEYLDLYLEIQQTRFGDRLRIQKEIHPATLEIAVPTLILQPLVENSIRHGLERRESGGAIVIRAWRQRDFLGLQVRDDGEGLKGGQLGGLSEGIGLSNTKARMQELYGTDHEFQIAPNPEGGLTVTLLLPWRPDGARALAVTGPNHEELHDLSSHHC